MDELLGDASRAAEHAEAVHRREPDGGRRTRSSAGLRGGRGRERELLVHLDAELAEATTDEARADLLAERARLVDAAGADASESRAAWERVLAVRSDHPAALRGLEAALAVGRGRLARRSPITSRA